MASESLLADANPRRFGTPALSLRKIVLYLFFVVTAVFLISYWVESFSVKTQLNPSKFVLAELVSEVSKGKATLVSIFEGPEGLTGLVIKGNTPTGKKKIAWAPVGSNVILFGPVVDKEGRDLTSIAEETQIRSVTSESNEVQPGNLGSYVFKKGQGDKIRHLSIIISPSCPSCQALLQKIQKPYVRFAEDVQVSLIPIARTDQDRIRGARLLETGSFSSADGQAKPSAASIATVARNTEHMLAKMNSRIKTPMLLHDGQLINSFTPFIVSPNLDRTASVQN